MIHDSTTNNVYGSFSKNNKHTLSGDFFGGCRPATLRSSGLVMRKADFLSGVTPSPFRHQLKAYTWPGYSFGKAAAVPTRLMESGSPSFFALSTALQRGMRNVDTNKRAARGTTVEYLSARKPFY